MATVETLKCDSWIELHTRIDQMFTHYSGYIFRGQADSNWPLESSLTRAMRKWYPEEKTFDSIVSDHLEQFKENIRGRCSYDLNAVESDHLWALGQHFGLYTPFLDWTRSPYVGLFFAFGGESKSGYRSLWALHEPDIEDLWPASSGKKSKKKLRIVKPLTHDNQRLVSQNGLFVDAPVGQSIDTIVAKAKDLNWVTMFKISFPDSITEEAKAALNKMNINYASLFPELSGSSLHANFCLEIEPYLDKKRTEASEK